MCKGLKDRCDDRSFVRAVVGIRCEESPEDVNDTSSGALSISIQIYIPIFHVSLPDLRRDVLFMF